MTDHIRKYAFRLVAFIIALAVGLAVGFGRYVYASRQGIFTSSAFMGHRFLMKGAYALGVDVNAAACEYSSCFNAMWGAAYGGYDDEIKFLIDHGADVNARPSKFRTTALMVASFKGNESTVRLLLRNGSDPNTSVDGETALAYATQRGHLEVVEILKQASAREHP